MHYFFQKKILIPALVLLLIIGGYFLIFTTSTFEFINDQIASIYSSGKKGSLTGTECPNAENRPIAIMISSDPEARPLSGIGQADIVFEMPITPNGVTRVMAVFQCEIPSEIGSVRSARADFIPFVMGLNALYAHFGGEKSALERLDSGITDNIDGLKYDGTTYYRKITTPRPHNAFTNWDLLKKTAVQLGYVLLGSTTIYPHEDSSESKGIDAPPTIYNGEFSITWRYDQQKNSYYRSRGDKPEIDKNSNKEVGVENVIVLHTTWSPINKDYLHVKTVGSGQITVYKNGQTISGSWQKSNEKAKLYFYDTNGNEIKLTPGKTWVEIVI